MLLRIFTNTTNEADRQLQLSLRTIYNGKTIKLLHDLGLDPQNDDWMAIVLIKFLFLDTIR